MFTYFLENIVHCGGFQAPPPQEAMMLGQNGCQEGQESQEGQEDQAEVRYTDNMVRTRPVAPAH